ncbi:hypothetical protein [Pantoea stewartii]|uniref:hypothetical protein n=1 Tax=Pantoea stewartii TaxID=66269 RepID=UPI0025A20567|nr:hypothetical protein [Pantoea stewartii]
MTGSCLSHDSARKGCCGWSARAWLTIVAVSALLIASSGHSVVAEVSRYSTIYDHPGAEEHAVCCQRNSGVQLSTCGDPERRCVRGEPEAGRFGSSSWMILAGNGT